jgi:putative transposase
LKSSILDKAYKNEYDASVKERLLLIIRVSSDKQHIKVVAMELHRSRAWAYKWYKRYNDEGLEGLRDKPRSGRPPFMDEDEIMKIRTELSTNKIGWDTKEVMDIIKKKTGVKYHQVHIRRLLHRWGFSQKMPQKRFVRRASEQERKDFKKSTSSAKHA